ncbi:MAG: helical backbone metal receptor [Gemmatimonadota bacterium]
MDLSVALALGVLAFSPVTPVMPAQAAGDTIRLTDDQGRSVVLAAAPTRIISLVPNASEILFALGEGHRLVARSRFDDYPPAVLALPSVGDAIRPAAELVLVHEPDMVVMVGGADNRRAVEEFTRLGIAAVVIRINTFEDLKRNILRFGLLTGRDQAASELWTQVQAELAAVADMTKGLSRPSVYYDIAYPPAFTIGAQSYLDSLISLAGGKNVFGDVSAPSPQVSLEAIAAREPQIVIRPLSQNSGYNPPDPVGRPGWSSLPAVRNGDIRTVEADLLHRLGPRVGRAARALALAIHPELGARPESAE